jgi:hypothetical protein
MKDVLKGAEPKQFATYAELIHPRGTQCSAGPITTTRPGEGWADSIADSLAAART